MKNLNSINKRLLKGESLANENFRIEVLTTLIGVYEDAVDFNENKLHNSDSDLDFVSRDEMQLASYIAIIGLAKSVAKTALENRLSVADENWRKTNLSDYKQSSKSSTIHMSNLKGLTEIMPFNQISSLLDTLYYDLNRKFEALRAVASNRKFEIEKQLIDYTIRKTISK